MLSESSDISTMDDKTSAVRWNIQHRAAKHSPEVPHETLNW